MLASLAERKREKPLMNADYFDLLELFNQHGVTYLIVGGYAVIFHAEPRATKDLDVFVATNEDNARAVCDALREFGAPMNDITVDDFTHPDRVIQIGIAPVRIDIKTRVEGVEFADAWAHRVEGEAFGLPLAFISREDLITAKIAAGRPQDLIDIDNLRNVHE